MLLGLGAAFPVDLGLNVLGGQAGAFFAHLWLRRFPRGPLEELTARAAGARRIPAAVPGGD